MTSLAPDPYSAQRFGSCEFFFSLLHGHYLTLCPLPSWLLSLAVGQLCSTLPGVPAVFLQRGLFTQLLTPGSAFTVDLTESQHLIGQPYSPSLPTLSSPCTWLWPLPQPSGHGYMSYLCKPLLPVLVWMTPCPHVKSLWLSIPTPRHLSQRTESRNLNRSLYMNIHSSTIHNNKMWKQPKCPWTDEWINKMWSIHTMDYYSAMKRNEVLTQAIAWMNLENTMLSGRSQAEGTNIVWSHLYEISRIGKLGSRIEVISAWGKGRMRSCCLMGTEFVLVMGTQYWECN